MSTSSEQAVEMGVNREQRHQRIDPSVGIPIASLRHLVEQIPAVTYIAAIDADSSTLYVSPQAEQIFGCPIEQYIAEPERWVRSIHPDDRDRVLDALHTCQETGNLFSEQYRIRRSDDSEIWVIDRASVFHDEESGHRFLQGVLFDITEQKRIERSLQDNLESLDILRCELERQVNDRNNQLHQTMTRLHQEENQLNQSRHMAMIGTMASGIAHEINNPLGAMLIAAQVAMRQVCQLEHNPALREMLQLIIHSIQRCDHIVKNLLQLARSGRSIKQRENLAAIIRHACEMASQMIDRDTIEIQCTRIPQACCCLLNAIEVEQVLVNLIRNAAEAGAGWIRIQAHRNQPPGRVTVTVTDNGRGMTEEQCRHACEPLYTTRRDDGGSGLGLIISETIINDHGGRLLLKSNGNEGTSICFDLAMVTSDRNRHEQTRENPARRG